VAKAIGSPPPLLRALGAGLGGFGGSLDGSTALRANFMTGQFMRTLIIGYGSTLRGDDAIGPAAAEWVRRIVHPRRAQVLVCHQLTPELAADLAQADLVVFIDAAENLAPGEVRVLRLMDSTAAPREHSHAVDPAWLVYTARVLYGHAPRAYAVVVGGASFALDGELSPQARRGVHEAVERVLELIEDCGDARDVDRDRTGRPGGGQSA
jgi:hydrogenase maturation protease